MTELVTSNKKQNVVVICPGRGTYNKEELGYLTRYHQDKTEIINVIDQHRAQAGQPSIKELDAMEEYNLKTHTSGDNASALIYGCAIADFAAINRDKYNIVAVTGNSMGWYITLAAAGALKPEQAINVINTMGTLVSGPGGATAKSGQVIYPVMDENWINDPSKEQLLIDTMADINEIDNCEIYLSIKLGGYWVLGGNNPAIKELDKRLPNIDNRYPMKLYNHASFHTPLLKEVSKTAQGMLKADLFNAPSIPMIDGQGHIWQPYSADAYAMHHYTLATQVYDYYDFSKSIEVAIKEYAPDKLIILGPGNTLGGAVGQTLINHKWHGMNNKEDFVRTQKEDPFILAMGHEEQRKLVVE